MKSIRIVFAAMLACVSASAQSLYDPEVERLLREDPSRAGVNLHHYEFQEVKDTPAPKGYKAFYISHYGRHGCRFDSSYPTFCKIREELSAAREAGLLTPKGEEVYQEVCVVADAAAGMADELTARGRFEHQSLADRMYHRFPEVFRGAKKVRSISSVVPRCIISQNAFTNSLVRNNTRLDISVDTGRKHMNLISDPESKNSDPEVNSIVKPLMGAYAKRYSRYDTLSFRSALFTDPEASRTFLPSASGSMKALFRVARISDCMGIDDCIFAVLPFDFLYYNFSRTNHSLYMRQCNSEEAGHIRLACRNATVRDIILKADEVIASGEYAADLRFGHDFPLMEILAHLGIEGFDEPLSCSALDSSWHGFHMIPMASNLQIVFYRSRKGGDVLVKFLYQEQEKKIKGLEPVSGPYYRWDDFKKAMAPNF